MARHQPSGRAGGGFQSGNIPKNSPGARHGGRDVKMGGEMCLEWFQTQFGSAQMGNPGLYLRSAKTPVGWGACPLFQHAISPNRETTQFEAERGWGKTLVAGFARVQPLNRRHGA